MAEEKKVTDEKNKSAELAEPATAAEGAVPAAADAKVKKIRKGGKSVPVGVVHILATFNNTQVTITDTQGHTVSWCTAGRCQFKGSRKSTAYAATVVAQEAAKGALAVGMNEVEIMVQGPGAGRESAIRAIQSAGIMVTGIRDVTPVPHNGCRPPKRRRV